MRVQILYLVSLGVVLVAPAVAIHVGGLLAYLGLVAVLGWLIAAWRRVVSTDRKATIKAIREAIDDPQPHQVTPAPSASAQD